jgi:hypothetical protein
MEFEARHFLCREQSFDYEGCEVTACPEELSGSLAVWYAASCKTTPSLHANASRRLRLTDCWTLKSATAATLEQILVSLLVRLLSHELISEKDAFVSALAADSGVPPAASFPIYCGRNT